ncbi:hypothetical protein FF38_09102, partial [Lucilia cuprina]
NITTLLSYEREFKAIMNVGLVKSKEKIINAEITKVSNDPISQAKYKRALGLTTGQAKAVSACVRGSGFQLIQGPPGTGKTKTVISLICALYSKGTGDKKRKLLVCAPSNAAVDELAMRLMGGLESIEGRPLGLKLVRLGRMERISPATRELTLESQVLDYVLQNPESCNLQDSVKRVRELLDKVTNYAAKLSIQLGTKEECMRKNLSFPAGLQVDISSLKYELVEAKKEFNVLKSGIMKRTSDIHAEILEEADIICSTLSHSDSPYFSSSCMKFDTIIIDEAAQASEPSTLIPLQFDHERCILVGDPKQLPPTVKSRICMRLNYEQSMFSRFFQKYKKMKDVIFMLDTQFRMHPEIASFPSKNFYQNKLRNADNNVEKFTSSLHSVSKALGPYSFFNVNGSHISEEVLDSTISHSEVDSFTQNNHNESLNLTDAQAKVVNTCMETTGFQLVQGPPGTGKTKTIVTFLKVLFGSFCDVKKEKVLLCAPSNAAVDVLASRLYEEFNGMNEDSKPLKIVRLGCMERISPETRHLTLESQIV